jgi:glycosyltransferase involved in cell wall biosynthesis
MHIDYIHFTDLPSRAANSIHVMKMCQAFKQEGHDIRLLVPTDRVTNDMSLLWRHYGIETPFPIECVPVPFDNLSDDGYWIKLAKVFGFAIRSVRYARQSHVSLIYTRERRAAMFASLLGVPVILGVHWHDYCGKLRWAYFRAMLKGRGFRRLVTNTKALKDIYLDRYAPSLDPEQVIPVPNGVDLGRFSDLPQPSEARRQLNMPSESFVAGYTGHLYPGRGIDLIIDLAGRLPSVIFLVVGGTDEDVQKYRKRLENKGLTNLILTGFVPNSELVSYLAACEVLLMPYQRKVEIAKGGDASAFMCPMKMFEYMATGRMIISSDLPVIHEVLNENNAVFCDPEDVIVWQENLEKARMNREWRMQIGQQAQRDVIQYAWRQRVHRVLEGIL